MMQRGSGRTRTAVHASLALLVAAGFALRFKGIWFGYPLPIHPDEPLVVDTALRIIATGDLNPHFFYYPTLNIYIQAALFRSVQIAAPLLDKSAAEIPIIWYYLAGRLFNVCLSVSTIIVTYFVGKRLFSPLAGLVAAFFLTFSYLHVVNSYLLTVDTTVAFWASLSTLMAAKLYTQERRELYYLVGGLFVGLAIGSKYTAFVAAAPLLIAHYARCRGGKRLLDRNIITYLIVIPLAFLVTSPYVLLDVNSFLADLRELSATYSAGHPGATSGTANSYLLYGRNLLQDGYGVAPTIFALLGLVWLLRANRWEAAIIAATPVLLYLFIGRYVVFFPRNVVAAIPYLALLSGAFFHLAYRASTERLPVPATRAATPTVFLLVAAILAGSVWRQADAAIDHIRTITLPDTRWVSLEWIQANMLPGTRIGREHYTPPIERFSDQFDVVYLGFFGAIKQPDAVAGLTYMIVSSGDYERFLYERERYPTESAAYLKFFETHELVKEFIPDGEELGGPRISIFRVRR